MAHFWFVGCFISTYELLENMNVLVDILGDVMDSCYRECRAIVLGGASLPMHENKKTIPLIPLLMEQYLRSKNKTMYLFVVASVGMRNVPRAAKPAIPWYDCGCNCIRHLSISLKRNSHF